MGQFCCKSKGSGLIGQVNWAIMRAMQNEIPQQDGYDYAALGARIKQWGKELGFQAVGISDTDLSVAEAQMQQWLAKGYHGTMDYMAKHGTKRSRPAELVEGTVRVISVCMDYYPAARDAWQILQDGNQAFISRYALGRDYHKVLRSRLEQLAQKIRAEVPQFKYRGFTDSAPVLEVALAEKARLGWRGKHSLLLSRDRGSLFFLGEIYIDLPLPADADSSASINHCGTCSACIDICPTQAIIAPYQVDARRCISYLTIEHRGSIPVEFRAAMGNRIYGCDDCQLACPWNRFAKLSAEADFAVRHGLDDVSLAELFLWSESTFNQRMAGSAIYRIGYDQWLRNIAVALGNAPKSGKVREALQMRLHDTSPVVREHIEWALKRQG